MFDSTPSNLPLEPMPDAPQAQTPPTPAPAAPPAAMPASSSRPVASSAPFAPSGKKEPEDIFADIDKPEQASSAPMMVTPPAPMHRSPMKGILIALIVVIVLGGAGFATWYFLIREPSSTTVGTTTQPKQVIPTTSEPIIEQPPVTEPTPPPIITPTPVAATTETEPEPVTIPPPGTNIPPPESIQPTLVVPVPVEATDSDADGLSDVEESLLGTNPTMPDSDGDGFADGAEVASGYDPAMPRSVLSMSTQLRKATIGTDWSTFVPTAWVLGSDIVPGDYALQTGSSATMAFHFGTLAASQSFVEWLRANEPTVVATDLRSFQTKQGNAAWQTTDRLTTYIVSGTRLVRIRYQLNGAPSYDFRALYDVMVERALVL